MRACGLTYEGTLRQAAANNQGVVDLCVYSILRSEYEARKEGGDA
jgi:ribosomal-protein-alanine N-acetyltransferase